MAARKNKAARTRKKAPAPARKSRLWVRDTLNILAGLLVGGMGVWLFQEYRDNRAARGVARKYLPVVQEIQPQLKPLADRYLALTQGREGEALPDAALDADRPVCSVDALRGVLQEACALPPDTASALLEFARNLQKADLLRKLLQQQEQDPDGFARALSNQLLLTVYDESRASNNLFWKLRDRAGRDALPEEEGTEEKGPEPSP